MSAVAKAEPDRVTLSAVEAEECISFLEDTIDKLIETSNAPPTDEEITAMLRSLRYVRVKLQEGLKQ